MYSTLCVLAVGSRIRIWCILQQESMLLQLQLDLDNRHARLGIWVQSVLTRRQAAKKWKWGWWTLRARHLVMWQSRSQLHCQIGWIGGRSDGRMCGRIGRTDGVSERSAIEKSKFDIVILFIRFGNISETLSYQIVGNRRFILWTLKSHRIRNFFY